MDSQLQSRRSLPAPLRKEVREAALAAHKAGERAVDIADRLNLKAVTVRAWISRERKRESPPRPDRVESAIGAPRKPAKIPDLPSLVEKQEFFQDRLGDAAIRLAAHVATLDGTELVKSADKLLKATQTARASLKLDNDRPATVIQIGVLANSPAKRDQDRLVLEKNRTLHSSVRPRCIDVSE